MTVGMAIWVKDIKAYLVVEKCLVVPRMQHFEQIYEEVYITNINISYH